MKSSLAMVCFAAVLFSTSCQHQTYEKAQEAKQDNLICIEIPTCPGDENCVEELGPGGTCVTAVNTAAYWRDRFNFLVFAEDLFGVDVDCSIYNDLSSQVDKAVERCELFCDGAGDCGPRVRPPSKCL